jgi:hypothetical protein
MVTLAIVASIAGALFAMTDPGNRAAAVQSETADVQQRLRVAIDAMTNDLAMAGAGAYLGARSGTLAFSVPSIIPSRQGANGDDPPGVFRSDTITILYVRATQAQAFLSQPLVPGSNTVVVSQNAACGSGASGPLFSCGFAPGDTVLICDDVGNFDVFALTAVAADGGTLTVSKPPDAAATTFKAGSTIVKIVSRTYFRKADVATGTYQLMRYDGATGSDIPVVDHLVGLAFEYYGEPQPPTPTAVAAGSVEPATTYGPAPPAAGVQPTGYPAGENCIFTRDPLSGQLVPRLATLGGPGRTTLTPLTAAELTDGPWCPDAAAANRFDADLLRIRKVAVTLRVEAAVDGLRGPSGALFMRGGTATHSTRWVPDQELRSEVSPLNLNVGR